METLELLKTEAGNPEEGMSLFAVKDYKFMILNQGMLELSGGVYAFDSETTGIEYEGRENVLFQFYNPARREVMLVHPRCLRGADLSNVSVVGHHLGFDFVSLLMAGCEKLPRVEYDTFLMANIHQFVGARGLKEMVLERFGTEMPLFDEKNPFKVMAQVEDLSVGQLEYACEDVVQAWRLYELMVRQYPVQEVEKLEFAVLPEFAKMTFWGLPIDREQLSSLQETLLIEQEEAKRKLFAIAGKEFNPGSPKQMQQILFAERGLVPVVMTPKGAPSTSEDALSYFEGDEFVDALGEYKEASGANSYFQTLLDYRGAVLHPYYKQVGFDGTSRVYTEAPSTNQMPRVIRGCIHPHTGMKFVYADWSGAELVTVAYMAGEGKVLDVNKSGDDIHTWLSEQLLDGIGVPALEKLTPEAKRNVSKTVTFAVLYGSRGASVSLKLKISQKDAESLIERFFLILPKIKALRDEIVARAAKAGYTETIIGRRRGLMGIGQDEAMKRKAFNTAIQGSVADLQKRAILDMAGELEKLGGRVLTTVFDSFLLEVPEDADEAEVLNIIKDCSQRSIPFCFKAAFGRSWLECMEKAK